MNINTFYKLLLGLGTYKVDVAGNQRAQVADMKPVSGDRSAVLQRKLDEAEKLYVEQRRMVRKLTIMHIVSD